MESKVRTYTYPDGTMQRVQTVQLPDWQSLEFLTLPGSEGQVNCFSEIFRQYLVPACPWLFGNLVLFSLPDGVKVPFSRDTGFGKVAGELTAAAAGLRRGMKIIRGKPRFRDTETADFWQQLEEKGCIRIVRGRLPITTVIPVGSAPGYLTETETEARLKANASFFIMDPFDCATVFDHVGTCLGLMVKDGVVENPPMYGREALLVRKDGTVTVENRDIRELTVKIGENTYRHGENCEIITRPNRSRVGGKGRKLVIVGKTVAAVSSGTVPVPASGFVLKVSGACPVQPGAAVSYGGMEDVAFGIQVGNSIIKDGVLTDRFLSGFYNIRRLEPVPYPPSLYPMDFTKSRAARMALGADAEGKPLLLWAEGAPKIGCIPGKHSRGASLSELGGYCRDAGMVNGVNLDGGGSAQLLLQNQAALEISDRKPDGTQAERLIPNALMIK